MSDRDNADRLNRSWDEFVNTPRGARGNSGDVDPTVGELHAMDQPESPDPEFRLALRQQLLREASFRSGQQRAESVIPSHQPTAPHVRRVNRWMESIAIAAVVVLVGSALIWALQIRISRDDEVTPTLELGATSPTLIVATPFASRTPAATPNLNPPTQSPSATPEPTEVATLQPKPGTPIATVIIDVCTSISTEIFSISSSLAEPSLPPEVATGIPASASQIAAVGIAVDEFRTCLGKVPIEELRSIVTEALQALGVSQLDSFVLSQQVGGLATSTHTISDVKLLPNGRISAIISLSNGTQFVGIFESDDPTSIAKLVQLYLPAPVEATATVIVDNSNQPTDTISDDAGDDDDDGGSGDDDDGGDDD